MTREKIAQKPCPNCRGEKRIDISSTEQSSGQFIPCPNCNGTGQVPEQITCRYEDWDDTTLPHPTCHCLKREGVDCANVPDDVAQCPDFKGKVPDLLMDEILTVKEAQKELNEAIHREMAKAHISIAPYWEQLDKAWAAVKLKPKEREVGR